MTRRVRVGFAWTLLAQVLLFSTTVCAGDSKASSRESTDWLYLGNGMDMHHSSELDAISSQNVGRLGLAWSVDLPGSDGLVGNPLVKDGIIYQSGALGRVYANRVVDGALVWLFEPTFDYANISLVAAWATRYNRGVALHGKNVIVAAGDCRLIALNQKTGDVSWEVQTCDPAQFYGITAAPRVSEDLVFTGNACMDTGVTRGYVDAFNATTGDHVWRFYTVQGVDSEPDDSELATLMNDSWGTKNVPSVRGCGSVWDAITYDSKLKQLYIGVAGPAPFDPSLRASDAGDELFTNSIVALDAETGDYIWHFKQVPNDGWNFDSSVGIMVVDLPGAGEESTRAVVSVPKNGFVYLLDAKTGKFISGSNYAPVNWAEGLDEDGRPIPAREAQYWLEGNSPAIVMPGPMGAHNWEALAYDRKQNLLYIPASIQPFEVERDPDFLVGGISGDLYYGLREDAKWKAKGELIAWDLSKQESRWSVSYLLPSNGGLLHTAGDLVFQGSADGYFTVFSSITGETLWREFVGGTIKAAPTTVMFEGEQYVLVPSGNAGSAAGPPVQPEYSVTPRTLSQPRLLAFKVDGDKKFPDGSDVLTFPPPLDKREADPDAEQLGRMGYHALGCAECHGGEAHSLKGSVPDLRVSMAYLDEQNFKSIVQGGSRRERGMPHYDFLEDAQVRAIYSYLNGVAREASAVAEKPKNRDAK